MGEKALKAKKAGNEAFAKGDYATAIGHYTAAIMDDNKEMNYYNNRSAAYLKLGKYEDAERDCSSSFSIGMSLFKGNHMTPNHVRPSADKCAKALYRRAQARIQMGTLGKLLQAKDDLSLAKDYAPEDAAINSALQDAEAKYDAALQKKAEKKAKEQALADRYSAEASTPKRRRVPITIVGEEPPTPSIPNKTTSDKPKSFKETKEARDNLRPSRVGGGIFRSTGSSTVFPTRETSTITSHSPTSEVPKPAPPLQPKLATTISKATLKTPETLFDFMKVWNSHPSPEERWTILQMIPPSKFPALCKTSLDPAFLSSIFATFETILTTGFLETQMKVKEYMDCMPNIARFPMVFMFLSRGEKEVVRGIWKKLGVTTIDGVWEGLLK